MSVKLLTEHDLEFLSLKGRCTGLSESTLVKMPHCWKSHITAHIVLFSSGTQEGHIIVFNVPAKGTNVVIKDILKGTLFIYFNRFSSPEPKAQDELL